MNQIASSGWPFDSKLTGLSEEGLPQGDRDGSAEDLAATFASFISDGVVVFEGVDAEQDSLRCDIVPDSMTVSINIGRIRIRGRTKLLAEPVIVEIPRTPEAEHYNIVMRLNLDDEIRSIQPLLTQGALVRSDTVWDLMLASLETVGGAYTLDEAVLTDTRDNRSVCGYSAFLGQPPHSNHIDCGYFPGDNALTTHNADPLAHQNLIIDGGDASSPTVFTQTAETSEESIPAHNHNPVAHRNLIIDGGEVVAEEG